MWWIIGIIIVLAVGGSIISAISEVIGVLIGAISEVIGVLIGGNSLLAKIGCFILLSCIIMFIAGMIYEPLKLISKGLFVIFAFYLVVALFIVIFTNKK